MALTHEQLAELRSQLEAERAQLGEDLREHGKITGPGGDWQGTATGFEEPQADEIDAADRFEELATNVSLVEELEGRLKEVQEALAKMDANTYGICEVSGEEIPLERLKANPAAKTTIEHAE